MNAPPPDPFGRLIRWGYWIVLVVLAIGAARTMLRLARTWGWI